MPPSIYRIDPEADRAFAEEFRRTPVGHHSPGLQRVLHAFRGEPLCGKYVLFCTKPYTEWRLARLSGERGKPMKFEDKFYKSWKKPSGMFFSAVGRISPGKILFFRPLMGPD